MKRLLNYSLILVFIGIIVFLNPIVSVKETSVKNQNLDYKVTNQDESSPKSNHRNENDETSDSKTTNDKENITEDENSQENSGSKDNNDNNDNNDATKKPLKYVALTFDDGPSGYTDKIVDLLKEYNYNATFFVLGNKLSLDYKKTLKKSLENGNEIGVHGYSHQSFTRMKKETIEEEINKTKKYVKNLTSYEPKLVRPPYGNINSTIKNYNLGPYILWNNDTLDWKLRDANKIYNRLLKSIEDKSIILMHDTYLTTYKALEIILPYLKENNYEVTTVSKIYELNGLSLAANKSYRYVK